MTWQGVAGTCVCMRICACTCVSVHVCVHWHSLGQIWLLEGSSLHKCLKVLTFEGVVTEKECFSVCLRMCVDSLNIEYHNTHSTSKARTFLGSEKILVGPHKYAGLVDS